MNTPDSLGGRMKAHEHVTRQVLPRRTWTLLRVDGRAFHSYTRGLERPFDETFAADMDAVAVALCQEVSGTAFAYVQSDEISVLMTDFATPGTQPWFGGVAAKMTSLSASLATATLLGRRPAAETGKVPLFDSRVFTVADPHEVAAYFVWRQRDAVKNSISMAAQAHFSHRKLQGLHSGAMQELLFSEAGVNWNNFPDGFKRGRVVTRVSSTESVTYVHGKEKIEKTEVVTRSRWVAQPAPHFTTEPAGWLLGEAVPQLPSVVRSA
jgi:tRNA(His) 5'-end guanylyltransferase